MAARELAQQLARVSQGRRARTLVERTSAHVVVQALHVVLQERRAVAQRAHIVNQPRIASLANGCSRFKTAGAAVPAACRR